MLAWGRGVVEVVVVVGEVAARNRLLRQCIFKNIGGRGAATVRKKFSTVVKNMPTVLTGDAAHDAYAQLTLGLTLSVPQSRFFRDCDSPLLVHNEHGFIAARRAPEKLFSANAKSCTEIGLVYVQPEKRGNGHCAALLEEIETLAPTKYVVVYAQTCIQNPIMFHLYRSAGFKAVFSTLERHAVEALTDPSAWEEMEESDFEGDRTVVLVKCKTQPDMMGL